jgi:hypothetical protein
MPPISTLIRITTAPLKVHPIEAEEEAASEVALSTTTKVHRLTGDSPRQIIISRHHRTEADLFSTTIYNGVQMVRHEEQPQLSNKVHMHNRHSLLLPIHTAHQETLEKVAQKLKEDVLSQGRDETNNLTRRTADQLKLMVMKIRQRMRQSSASHSSQNNLPRHQLRHRQISMKEHDSLFQSKKIVYHLRSQRAVALIRLPRSATIAPSIGSKIADLHIQTRDRLTRTREDHLHLDRAIQMEGDLTDHDPLHRNVSNRNLPERRQRCYPSS